MTNMTKKQVHDEMESMLGLVPSFFKSIPPQSLEAEWLLFQQMEMEPGPIPLKMRHLIGLAMHAVTKCKYCLFYHTEMAMLHGASPQEMEAAVHYAKSSMGWSTYITGLSTDFERFRSEILTVCDHIRVHNPVST